MSMGPFLGTSVCGQDKLVNSYDKGNTMKWNLMSTGLALALTALATLASFYLLEKPLLEFKRKFQRVH